VRNEDGEIAATCFYETLPLVRLLIVPNESALISGDLSHRLPANHTANDIE
jgi:hypothetical protein